MELLHEQVNCHRGKKHLSSVTPAARSVKRYRASGGISTGAVMSVTCGIRLENGAIKRNTGTNNTWDLTTS